MTQQNDLEQLKGTNFLLSGRLDAETTYADGITQLAFGAPVTRLLLHSVMQFPSVDGTEKEIRKATQLLTMPTAAAIEMAYMILSFAKRSEDRLMKDLNEDAKPKVERMLKSVQITGVPPGVVEQPTK